MCSCTETDTLPEQCAFAAMGVSQPLLQVQVPVLLLAKSPGALEALRPRQQRQDSSAREQHQLVLCAQA